uniref:Peptidase_M13 domain-containing protein n=1 Tax=Parastrongyloides trichosuri TaxID=131310 RepID=A0A0N4Z7I4_PARTI
MYEYSKIKQIVLLLLIVVPMESYSKKVKPTIDYELIDKILNETINVKVDPCHDFNQFSCGKWLNNKDLFFRNVFFRTGESIDQMVDIFFNKYIIGKITYSSSALETLKFAYKSCVTFNLSLKKTSNIKRIHEECRKEIKNASQFLVVPIIINEMIGINKINEHIESIKEMFINMKETFKEIIEEKKWLDRETKDRIMRKIDAKEINFTLPKKLKISEIDKEYEILKLHPNSNFLDIKNLLKSFYRLFNRISKLDGFGSFSNIVPNAAYNVYSNTVLLYLTFLLEPLYGTRFMTAMRYGGFGTVLAHEILHGYSGRSLNVIERYKINELLTEYSQRGYRKRTQCIINQYQNQTMEESDYKVNGTHTHTENISDNSGIKLAFRTYKKIVKKYGEEENKMKTFGNLTNDQLFYISYAQYFCEKYRPEVIKKIYYEDKHMPGELRILNVVKNQKEFAETFNCKADAEMNPDEKCEIWKSRRY